LAGAVARGPDGAAPAAAGGRGRGRQTAAGGEGGGAMMELVCPAGNFTSLKAAVDNGADAVYMGFNDHTNARSFSGLNFSDKQVDKAIDYARSRGKRVFVAINTSPHPARLATWEAAVDRAAAHRADALILADLGLMAYAAERHPLLPLHLSAQAS